MSDAFEFPDSMVEVIESLERILGRLLPSQLTQLCSVRFVGILQPEPIKGKRRFPMTSSSSILLVPTQVE